MTTPADRFSLISQSIPNRFTCNFAHTIRSHCCDCSENLVRFDRVLPKVINVIHSNNTVSTSPERWKCGPSLKQHWGSALPPSYMCDWAVRTDEAGRQDWESNYQHYSDIAQYRFFFFFFFSRYDTQLKINEKRLLFRNTPYWGRCKTPYLHCLMTFDVWFWRQSRQTKNERNVKTVTMTTNPLSTMRLHWSLGIFVIIFTRFSLISQSILNRFSCNFAGTTCNYSGDCPDKFVKFEQVLLKLLVRLVVNLLEYFKIYSFRRQFRRQFSTVYHVILQAPSDGITATAL